MLTFRTAALFPTWHRALTLLIEVSGAFLPLLFRANTSWQQAVVNEAIAIASQLEDESSAARDEKWLQAAKQLRFP